MGKQKYAIKVVREAEAVDPTLESKPSVSLDAKVTTREELARWLEAAGNRLWDFPDTADVPEDLTTEIEDAADALSTLSHMMLAELGLADSCAGRGAPFGDDTFGNGADDDEDEAGDE